MRNSSDVAEGRDGRFSKNKIYLRNGRVSTDGRDARDGRISLDVKEDWDGRDFRDGVIGGIDFMERRVRMGRILLMGSFGGMGEK